MIAERVRLHRRHLSDSQRALIATEVRRLYAAEAREAEYAGLRRGTSAPTQVKERERGAAETAARAAEQLGDR